ncbi:MAG: hypothetical protein PVG91_11200 [Gammaproteobacteria bacterium]|jgi:hypothetical protein
MSEVGDRQLSRVLIALDPAAPTPTTAAARAISELVPDLRRELIGLFVEDANLLRLCGLSCVREVSIDTGVERGPSLELMETQLRAQRIRMERRLVRTARMLHLPHRFRVARGEVREELRTAVAQTDLVLIGRATGVAGARSWMGWRLHELVGMVPRTLAIVNETWRAGRSILAVCADDRSGQAALAMAARLARVEKIDLVVALPDSRQVPDESSLIATLARNAPLVKARWVRLEEISPARLAALARRADPRALVLGVTDVKAASKMVEAILPQLRCSIVTVRPGPVSTERRTPAGNAGSG